MCNRALAAIAGRAGPARSPEAASRRCGTLYAPASAGTGLHSQAENQGLTVGPCPLIVANMPFDTLSDIMYTPSSEG